MSPKLRGADIPRGARGAARLRIVPAAGEVPVVCTLEPCGCAEPCEHPQPCDWRTVRPAYAADSAELAHRIRHAKGMLP